MLRRDFPLSTEEWKNSSELRILSSEVSFHSSEVSFHSSEEIEILHGAIGDFLGRDSNHQSEPVALCSNAYSGYPGLLSYVA